MNKWYQGIVVEHKELDNKMYHCFDDENFEKITNERNEQLKEIERLNNIINELEKMLEQTIENSSVQPHIEMAEYTLKELQELKGSDKE